MSKTTGYETRGKALVRSPGTQVMPHGKKRLTFSVESTDPRATLVLEVLDSFAEFERSIIRDRQAEGIVLAKKAGKYKSRKRALTPDQVQEDRRRAEAGDSKTSMAAGPPFTEHWIGMLSYNVT